MKLLMILSETPAPGDVVIDDTWYSPGVVGFVATFGMAAAAMLLIFDLARRVRRVRYRAEISERLDQEQLDNETKANPNSATKPERPAPPESPTRP